MTLAEGNGVRKTMEVGFTASQNSNTDIMSFW